MAQMAKPDDFQLAIPKKSHSSIEDILAMIIATFIISFGMMLMQKTAAMTGGTAGLSLLIHYITGIKFGLVFFTINIPFYYLAFKRLGMPMVIKTFVAVGLLSILTEVHPVFIHLDALSPVYAAILANVFMGLGFFNFISASF